MVRPKKTPRVRVDDEVAAHVMFLSDRICCVCNVPGKRGQIHHIDGDRGNGLEANLAFLCLECHDETQITGGFGRKLDAAQVIKFRDSWYERVRRRRAEADAIAIAAVTAATAAAAAAPPVTITMTTESSAVLTAAIPLAPQVVVASVLPRIRREAAERAKPLYEGSTMDMREGLQWEIAAVVSILVALATFYPKDHFGSDGGTEYFYTRTAELWRWHVDRVEIGGRGTGGTIVPVEAGLGVLGALEGMVPGMLAIVIGDNEAFDFAAWRTEWDKACGR